MSQPPRPPMYEQPDPLVGKLFNERYEVIERIGEGGMGAVYRAKQVAMDRMVALKVIRDGQEDDDTAIKRFHREMKATSRITHPNTVNVYDFGTTQDGTHYLAMELLVGHSLADEMDKGPMPLDRATAVGLQILKALSAAHAERVIHRDLKPDNIMLLDVYGDKDQVRVLDFGIATFAQGPGDAPVSRVTASGIMVGTPSYVSPEQISGEDLDARADLYSFGVLWFEMLTGKLPFEDPERPMRVLQMHMTTPPPRPSAYNKDLPHWVDALLLSLLGKYPDDRPKSADEVIGQIESPEEPAPPAVVPKRQTGTWAVAGIAIAAIIGVALVVGVLVGFFGANLV